MSHSPEPNLTTVDDWHAAYNARDVEVLVRLTLPEIEIVPHQPLGAALVGVHTVRTHVQNGIERTGAKTRMHALSLALERGEIGSKQQ